MYFVQQIQIDNPAPAQQVQIQQAREPERLLPAVGGAVPDALKQPVFVPDIYKYGACQAIDYVAYQVGYKLVTVTHPDATGCGASNRADALPDIVGVGHVTRTAYDWVSVLAAQLPYGTRVAVDEYTKSITVAIPGF